MVATRFVIEPQYKAAAVTTRAIRRFEEAGLLYGHGYGTIMDDLRTPEIAMVDEGGEWAYPRTTRRARELADGHGLEPAAAA